MCSHPSYRKAARVFVFEGEVDYNMSTTTLHTPTRVSLVIDDQLVKAVRFKVEISEKSVPLPSTTIHQTDSTCNTSTPLVGTTLSSVDTSNGGRHVRNGANSNMDNSSSASTQGSSDSSGSCSPAVTTGTRAGRKGSTAASRRASDGGSILSMAAAAVTSHFSKIPFHSNTNSPSGSGNRHSLYGAGSNSGDAAPPQMQLQQIVKVTLHQQQGANSTLRMIYERLCSAWDLQDLETKDEQPIVASPVTLQ